MNETPDPSMLAQYGPLGLAVFVFASVIVYLFRLLMKKNEKDVERAEAIAKERATWDVERERLRTEYEEKHRELVERFAEETAKDREANRMHEDLVRKEFADLMERVSEDNVKSSDAMVQMLQKFHDRFVGPSSRRR